ncbi:hypothetical protein CFAEC_01690 [Corynebacterium faecale]|uniref:hypothetical protein n=1 Tax=Corynebacterium faecale TaxID=1758466 RepID=UPI0025B2EAF8|nr:hypothetical protein [Corynebacterium faecale]WJY91197.1 hypothetical protein CFAEC_01690 [Corynebacterium faecale]
MSEEKLTVAELMARAAKEGHSTDAPRRRRRRSLEDGGVSVAELTGSIPAVKEKPAESRHSAVKIDDPATPPATPVETPASAVSESPVEAAEVKAAPQVAPKAEAKPEVAAEPAVEVTPAAEPVAAPQAEESTPEKAELPVKPAPVRSAPSEDETMVLSIVDEKDPIRLTTGAFPVVPASAVKPAQVQQSSADTQDAEAAADAEFAATGSEDRAADYPADTMQMDATTGELEVSDAADEAEEKESGKVSVFSVLLMAIVGVVLGAAVFLAFEMLWERLNNWLVALLAIAVTLGMVGIVHALRTSRDGFSMVLAGVVGLVMTFGPLLIVF